MATIARADLLRLITQTVYVLIDSWETSHREGEYVVQFRPVDEIQLSLSLHVSGTSSVRVADFTSSLPIHVRTITDIRIHQIDVSDQTGVIESHMYRVHPYRFDEAQATVSTLFSIAVGNENSLHDFLAKSHAVSCKPKQVADDIIQDVCNAHNVLISDVLGKRCFAELVRVRKVIAKRMRAEGHGVSEIGRALRRNHSSVCNLLRK